MAGLVWQSREKPELPLEARALIVIVLALGVHCVPMLALTLSSPPLITTNDDTVTIDFPDLPTADASSVKPVEPEPKAVEAAPKSDALKPAPAPKIPAAIASTPPPSQTGPPPSPSPAKPETAAAQAPQLKPLLAPMDAPSVAFDESKVKGTPSKDAYLSDRDSSAADRGPKNLPRGDPYMDKGQSKQIRYQETRGEGNLLPTASDANSGSVKKEGSENAGKGVPEAHLAEEKLSKIPAPAKGSEVGPPISKAPIATPEPAPAIEPKPLDTPRAIKPSAPLIESDDGSGEFVVAPKEKKVAEALIPQVAPTPKQIVDKLPPEPAPVAVETKQPDAQKNELQEFAALLAGKNTADGLGGNIGDKPGINAREGAKGHEGNGTLRPGHADAVSDVTTLNLETSAEETDDARFSKKYDPTTTYFKKLFRRIDGKWKAEIVARDRIRITRGVVSFKIVIRSDGTLLEAREVKREPAGTPDEYSAIAKTAIERATSPISDPFPASLAQDNPTLEKIVSFIY